MATRTAIIDIGSNSARLVIFQKTSEYGFHLVCEQKSRVRIGEGAYKNGGNLQTIGTTRAYAALELFSHTIKEFSVEKTICVATSALRDAPNRNIFIDRVKSNLGLSIEVITGQKEAYYGATAANNLLPVKSAITIDIGGGSTDMALIVDGSVVETCSLNLGTVRLKELFFDKHIDIKKARLFIQKELKKLPDSFKSHTAIGIGGSARALSKAIMLRTEYPLDKIHAFSYSIDRHIEYMREIISSPLDRLSILDIKQNRHDTIREGVLILTEVLARINSKEMIVSGVGVREGVYLHHLLGGNEPKFPRSINPSLQSILDRFNSLNIPTGNRKKISKKLYKLFSKKIDTDIDYFWAIDTALLLSDIGKMLTIYQKHKHAQYITMQELNYDFTHSQMMLISILLSTKENKGYSKELYEKYRSILPSKRVIKYLSFIYSLSLILHRNTIDTDIDFRYNNTALDIISEDSLYLAKESIATMKKPKKIDIIFG